MDSFDDIPPTGGGLIPPTLQQIPGRLLAVELRVQDTAQKLRVVDARVDRYDGQLERLFWVVLCGSLGVMVTVTTAALYVGGRFQAVTDLDRRVGRMEAHLDEGPR